MSLLHQVHHDNEVEKKIKRRKDRIQEIRRRANPKNTEIIAKRANTEDEKKCN